MNYFQSYTSFTLPFFHHMMDNFPKELAETLGAYSIHLKIEKSHI